MSGPSSFGVSKRWADNLARGMVALLVAAVGFVIALIADWLSIHWLGVVGFVICAAGVLGGFLVIAFGFIIFPSEMAAKFKQLREHDHEKSSREP